MSRCPNLTGYQFGAFEVLGRDLAGGSGEPRYVLRCRRCSETTSLGLAELQRTVERACGRCRASALAYEVPTVSLRRRRT